LTKDPASSPEDLAGSTEKRAAKHLSDSHQTYQDLLRLAKRVRDDMGLDPKLVLGALDQAEKEFESIAASVGGKIVRRNHPKVSSTDTCTIYIDECGQHSLEAKDPFKAFTLASIIVRDSDATDFDRKWMEWKQLYLGSADKLVHEPDVRQGKGSFWFKGDAKKRRIATEALPGIIQILPYCGIACVIHREKYVDAYGKIPPNNTLPYHAYLMALHFLAERIALALQHNYGGAKARLVFEARGPKEDASLQYEFARLFLDGTAYLSATYFRHQFFPGLQFKSKNENDSGLQVADLLARPCAEKVLDPTSDPPRWEAFKSKLCQGQKTGHSILGLKILPWDDCYNAIFEDQAKKS
jgi:hypothetical protein